MKLVFQEQYIKMIFFNVFTAANLPPYQDSSLQKQLPGVLYAKRCS